MPRTHSRLSGLVYGEASARRERAVIAALSGGAILGTAALADAAGCPPRAALLVLHRLEDSGVVARAGGGRGDGVRWRITNIAECAA